ncbi:MAG: hypothetical protein QG597_3787 [Actinomycetota bacterium]|nr:hypothetical protein [Actinomycetota bacterium]
MTIAWNYGDVGQHAATIGSSASSLEAVHQQILGDVNACADFWKSQGAGAYEQFVTELNRNFRTIFENLADHGTRVNRTLGDTEANDKAVGSSWGV